MKACKRAGVALLVLAGAAQAADGLRFEDAFIADDGHAPLHYRASYVARGSQHTLEAWLDAGVRLKRVTDGAVEVHAERDADGPEFRMTLLDLRRRIATYVNRTSLYRIGQFTDWFELAQGLRRPRAGYRLVRSAAPAQAPRPIQPCEWYELTQAGQASRICWSPSLRLPLLLLPAEGEPVWRVTEADRDPIPAREFDVDDRGFVRNDAGADISGD
jgi:hypothetical protein